MAINDQGMTNTSIRRTMVTWLLRIFGGLCLVAAVVYAGLLIFVPLLKLKNASWEREDNPVTVPNILIAAAVGVGCLWLSRTSDRTRFWGGLTVFILAVAYGIYSELL